MLYLILLVVAAVLFALAALGFGGRVNLLAAGLFCWILIDLLKTVDGIR